MKSKILCTLLALACGLAAQAGTIALTYPNGGETIAPGRTISMTWSNNNITDFGYLQIGIFEEPLPGMDPVERMLVAPCFIFPGTDSCTNVPSGPDADGGPISSYQVTIPADMITSRYRLHLMIIDSNHFVVADDISDSSFQVANISSSIDLTRPAQDLNPAAGSSVNIKFMAADVAGPIDIQLVDTLDQANWFSTGQAEIKPNSKGVSSGAFTIRTDIPPGSYGIRLVGTSASSGETVYSPSSLTIHLTSSIVTPKPNATVKKGKSYVVAWKGTPPPQVDVYSVYFQGDVTTEPVLLGSVPSAKRSARVVVPVTPDTKGQFLLVGKAWEVMGNIFNLK